MLRKLMMVPQPWDLAHHLLLAPLLRDNPDMVDHLRFSLLYPFFLFSVVLCHVLIIKPFFHSINLSFSSIIPD